MNIGNKIKKLRLKRGYTQEQLANIIGVTFQAVSKWENNIALPDITLVPLLASCFGVSTDVLFDFDSQKTKEKVLAIAKESYKYRESDQKKAREILTEGLKQYPNNDVLLLNMLYVSDVNAFPDEALRLASQVIDSTEDGATRYDAYRFMAYAYKAKNDLDSARAALDKIPEIYFSRLSEKACILTGKEKWESACYEEGQALYTLLLMKEKIAEYHIEENNLNAALEEYRRGIAILDIMNAAHSWNGWRQKFKEKIEKLSSKL